MGPYLNSAPISTPAFFPSGGGFLFIWSKKELNVLIITVLLNLSELWFLHVKVVRMKLRLKYTHPKAPIATLPTALWTYYAHGQPPIISTCDASWGLFLWFGGFDFYIGQKCQNNPQSTQIRVGRKTLQLPYFPKIQDVLYVVSQMSPVGIIPSCHSSNLIIIACTGFFFLLCLKFPFPYWFLLVSSLK